MFTKNVYRRKPENMGFFHVVNNKHSFSKLFYFYKTAALAKK